MVDDDFLESVVKFLNQITPNPVTEISSSLTEKPDRYKNPVDILKEWLRPLGLESRTSKFIMSGYTDMFSLLTLDQETLSSIGILDASARSIILNDLDNVY